MEENKMSGQESGSAKEPKAAPEVHAEPMGSGSTQGEGQKDGDETLYGILAYLGILFLIPLLIKKDNEFCQFHAKQGMVLFFAEVVGTLTSPIFGIGVLINLAALIFTIMGIVAVVHKEKKELPIVADIVKKLGL